MTTGAALRGALGDFYRHSWRLFGLNAALAIAVALVLAAASFWRPALVALVLLGPLAAALMHCAVTLVRTEDVRFRDALEGLRLHWRRGLEVGAIGTAVAALGFTAFAFYARAHALVVWGLAFCSVYVLFLLGLYLLIVLALAVARPARGLRGAAERAAELVALRPRATLGLGLALALVNVAGIAAGLMPFLTLTVAYSFLAAARFAITEAPD
jgi:hypothetical protein